MDDRQVVLFKLMQEDYGLPIDKVREINRMRAITKLPNTPAFLEGILDLRGRIIPVVDLRKWFGFDVIEYQEETRIIVVDVAGRTVGIIVDAVHEVVRLDGAGIEPPPATFIMQGQLVEAIGKLGNRLIILLDIDRLLSLEQVSQLKSVAS